MIQTYPYTTPGNYTVSDENKIEISGGKASLKLQQDNVDFIEDFADDTGKTYDSDLAEFTSGLVRTKDKRPTNCVFYASYTNDINGSWGNGTLTGTPGGNTNVHDGYLDLSTGGYVEYPIDNFASMSSSAGCIRLRVAFTYSGASPSTQYLTQTSPNVASRVYLVHNATFIQCYITNTGGTTIYSMTFSWTPTSGVIYEFEVNWNSTHAYIFINGVKEDEDTGTLGIAEPSLFRIGSNTGDKFKIYDIAVFSTLQHSSNYTPSWSDFYETAYLGSSVILPEMEHTGDGSIKLFNSLTSAYAGSPRILLEIGRSGDKLYWNGSAWVISNETYDQATDPTTFNTNCPTLDVDSEKYGQFTIVFPDSNTLSSFDTLTANLNVDIGYPTDNPYIYPNSGFKTDGLENWIETLDELQGDDAIKRLIKLNNDYYYLDNDEWVTTDTIDYTKAMTVTEILAQKESLLTEGYGKTFIPITFLHSEDGSTTPYLDTDIITYNYSGDDYLLSENIIYYNNLDISGNAVIEEATVKPIYDMFGETTLIREKEIDVDIKDNGYWEVHLFIEDKEPEFLLWNFGGTKIKTNFKSGTIKFSELTILG